MYCAARRIVCTSARQMPCVHRIFTGRSELRNAALEVIRIFTPAVAARLDPHETPLRLANGPLPRAVRFLWRSADRSPVAVSDQDQRRPAAIAVDDEDRAASGCRGSAAARRSRRSRRRRRRAVRRSSVAADRRAAVFADLAQLEEAAQDDRRDREQERVAGGGDAVEAAEAGRPRSSPPSARRRGPGPAPGRCRCSRPSRPFDLGQRSRRVADVLGVAASRSAEEDQRRADQVEARGRPTRSGP